MEIYLIVVLSLSIFGSLAKTTGWRPKKDPNWYHALDVIIEGIALAWVVYSII